MEDRLTAMESKIAFSEDLLEELNIALYRQQQQIDRLQQQILALHRQIGAGAPAEARNLREEIPPHY